MLKAQIELVEPNRVTKYRVHSDGSNLTFSDVLRRWQEDAEFRAFFTNLLANSPFSAYRWETPSISRGTIDREFEFVLLNFPEFSTRRTDALTYRDYFTTVDADCGIVTFPNISGDATLVFPSPRTDDSAYGHMAAFIRRAPDSQSDAFWRVIASTVWNRLNDKPIWLNTAGGGVAWLHVRLDTRPKYYGFPPYEIAN